MTHITYLEEAFDKPYRYNLARKMSNFYIGKFDLPDGGDITVTVASSIEDKERFVNISFADTGCGIEEDKLDKVFQSFFSSKRDMNNLGLGLSISNQIIKDHKGKISVASTVGKGTVFTITLPMITR